MFCPMEFWNLGPDDRPPRRYRVRKVLYELFCSLSVLSWLGHIVVPPQLPEEDEAIAPRTPIRQAPSGPPSGHPERVTDDGPLTDAERELWVHLEGLDWR
jgi:uncharacterized protein DUF6059